MSAPMRWPTKVCPNPSYCSKLLQQTITANHRSEDFAMPISRRSFVHHAMLITSGTAYVDHAIAEVYLKGRWIKVDSYVTDRRLVAAARKKLLKTREQTGFGIHINGNSQWDGATDNFIQCLNDGSIQNYVLKDHGVFADVADFYQQPQQARNRSTFFSALALRLGHSFINRQIQSVRAST
jgi:hypothetical protein